MKQPLALTWEDQIRLLEKRGLIVKADDVEKIKHISYYRIKEFAKPLEININRSLLRAVFLCV